MTKEELNRLPTMIGTKQVLDCLGISPAGWYRALKKGRIRHPIKFGIINKWHKEYIFRLMENDCHFPAILKTVHQGRFTRCF